MDTPSPRPKSKVNGCVRLKRQSDVLRKSQKFQVSPLGDREIHAHRGGRSVACLKRIPGKALEKKHQRKRHWKVEELLFASVYSRYRTCMN